MGRVAIERGDGPVVDALLAGGLQVVVVSSRQVKALRLRYGTAGNKHDRFDAPSEVPMEEVYYFQVEPRQGFGFMRVYTDPADPDPFDYAYPVEHGDTVLPPMAPVRLGRERTPSPAALSRDGTRLSRRSSDWLNVHVHDRRQSKAHIGVGPKSSL